MTLPLLLVDDDPDACATVAKLLWAWGYQADVAHDGPTALKMIDQKPYALAIIDYEMPGMNGLEMFQRMRRQCPVLSGVFVTGHTTVDVVFPAIDAGVLRVFSKPVDFKELMPIVQQQAGVPY
jgi:two-component system, NtrC family, response regulator HydG